MQEFNLNEALNRVNKTRARPKFTHSQKMNYKLFDMLAAEGKLKDTWVAEAARSMMSEEEAERTDNWLDSLKK